MVMTMTMIALDHAQRRPPGGEMRFAFVAATETTPIRGSARISRCGCYRYRLTRSWGDGPKLAFVMLNPSIADAMIDDPTIRRCMGFARREGAAGIVVANLCAFRATTPSELKRAEDPFGPRNRDALLEVARHAERAGMPLVCAWGAHGDGREAVGIFRRTTARLACLGRTACGAPRHPLYVRADRPLEQFS
jgi:hypothetical protein